MNKITFGRIYKQLQYDLIGKDSQRGITLSYGWLANQFGHFGLGFIPTILFFLLYQKWFPEVAANIWAPATTAIMWTCFETYNFLGPLLKNSKTEIFKPDWKNVGFDTFCDLIFFYIGAAFAGFLNNPELVYGIICIALLLGTYGIFMYWYPIKMYSQYAMFPFQYRLSQWKGNISNNDKEIIIKLLDEKLNYHFLLFGNENSGKTSLTVSIATEFTIKRRIAWYTTAIKSASIFQQSNQVFKSNNSLDWSWREAEILVIDDISVGGSQEDVITPMYFKQAIELTEFSNENKIALQNQSVIWVVGSIQTEKDWKEFIMNLGISKENIICIQLG